MLKHVVLLAATGIVMGLLTTFVGLPVTVEPFVWFAFYAAWVVVVVKANSERPFTTIVIASVGSGLLAGTLQASFMTQYAANNPWYADQINEAARSMFVVQGLVAGLAFGVLVGGIAWFVLRRRRAAEEGGGKA